MDHDVGGASATPFRSRGVPPGRRRGPLSELELADQIGRDIEMLLAEMGDIRTGTPLDWFPLTGIGGA